MRAGGHEVGGLVCWYDWDRHFTFLLFESEAGSFRCAHYDAEVRERRKTKGGIPRLSREAWPAVNWWPVRGRTHCLERYLDLMDLRLIHTLIRATDQ